ncbi:hypothetical protein PHYSODRAFT_246701 [Phytophthora sojae]|uniref:Uncharacterized protein n=1 Tax=Phytophthora sojae (strain P6497) TaxID=1094619 RepID=G5A1J8_PHYSP|nr:hypothetical protein PHYSODRAFT_246701 [Phytophthora sojae]EGZ10796.1 hypothetical protein PHYSODRAFT_246701 [Phytophthora sojae]|eukprot:XP_009533541.1 hypothetical protein PHYSODRAFT_246701 [Phytophthora sojae]
MDERKAYPGQRKKISGTTSPKTTTAKKTTAKTTTAKTTTAKTTTAKKTVVTTSTATTTTGKMTTAKTKRQHVHPTSTNNPKRVRYSSRVTDEPMPTQPVQHDTQLQTRFAEMERARNNYYTVLSKEQDLRIHAAYNGGTMVGIIEAALAGA